MDRAIPRLLGGLCVLLASHTAPAQVREASPSGSTSSFAFAATADPRAMGKTWINALTEIRDRRVNPAPEFPPAAFLIVAGDLDPAPDRHNDFLKVFADTNGRPAFLPVVGNHEFEKGGATFRDIRDRLIPAIPGVARRSEKTGDYVFDHRNVRVIAVDAYTEMGQKAVIGEKGRLWVEQVIRSSPPAIEHVILTLHAPFFPRIRHTREAMDAAPAERDAFWRMLLLHRDRVRAVIVGHTHNYYRMRVADPAGPAADSKSLPDEAGGLWQIDVGAAGNAATNTVVLARVDGPVIRFRTLQARAGPDQAFIVREEWEVRAETASAERAQDSPPVSPSVNSPNSSSPSNSPSSGENSQVPNHRSQSRPPSETLTARLQTSAGFAVTPAGGGRAQRGPAARVQPYGTAS